MTVASECSIHFCWLWYYASLWGTTLVWMANTHTHTQINMIKRERRESFPIFLLKGMGEYISSQHCSWIREENTVACLRPWQTTPHLQRKHVIFSCAWQRIFNIQQSWMDNLLLSCFSGKEILLLCLFVFNLYKVKKMLFYTGLSAICWLGPVISWIAPSLPGSPVVVL